MKIIDPGHVYELQWLDGEPDTVIGVITHAVDNSCKENRLIFVKREGEMYPGNVGTHPGTTIQEVLRVLIDRIKYLDKQIPDTLNAYAIDKLRGAIHDLEWRAAKRHDRLKEFVERSGEDDAIELLPTCPKCLHIGCEGTCR